MDDLLDPQLVESIREIGRAGTGDSFLKELFEIFSTQSELSATELLAATKSGDLKQIKYYSHRLKGSAANIGAVALSRKAQSIEVAVNATTGTVDPEAMQQAAAQVIILRARSVEALADALFKS